MAKGTDKTSALAVSVATRLKTGERVKLKGGQRDKLFVTQVQDSSSLNKKITDLEKQFFDQYPACKTCDGIQSTEPGKMSEFVSYNAAGVKALSEAAKIFDKLRTINTDLGNKKAKFLKPGPVLVTAMQSAGVSGGKKKGGRKKKRA